MMTKNEQRIAIAEWMGWKILDTTTSIQDGRDVHWWSKTGSMLDATTELPVLDLELMHQAETLLTIPESVEYETELDCVVNAAFTAGESVTIYPTWHATASQRSEALCRTLWPERFQ